MSPHNLPAGHCKVRHREARSAVAIHAFETKITGLLPATACGLAAKGTAARNDGVGHLYVTTKAASCRLCA